MAAIQAAIWTAMHTHCRNCETRDGNSKFPFQPEWNEEYGGWYHGDTICGHSQLLSELRDAGLPKVVRP